MEKRITFDFKKNITDAIKIILFQLFIINLIFVTTVVAGQGLENVKINLNANNSKLEKIFEKIEGQTEYKFFYIKNDIPLNSKMTINAKNAPLSTVLDKIAKKNNLSFKLIKHQIVIRKNEQEKKGKGKIKGVIIDAQSGKPLPYANVFLKGTTYGSATDMDGKYLIENIPPGNYKLIVQYLGYEKKELDVTLIANKRLKVDFKLNYLVIKGKEIVVAAQAEGQIAAINEQLKSKRIVNVVSSQRIQELPDQNAAESVGRLPGVSVLRNGGEGTHIVIRGLSPRYNSISVAGVQLTSTNTNDRSVDLSMISPYMLEGIEVAKTITSDMDANSIGGSVNFKLRKARKGLKYDFLLQGGYNSLKKTYNDYKFVANVANRFFEDKLGVFFQIDISNRNRNSNIMSGTYELNAPELNKENNPIIYGLGLNDLTRIKKKYDGTLVLDYKIPNGSIVFNNFYSLGYSKAETRTQSFQINSNSHSYTTNDTKTEINAMISSLHYEQKFNLFNINADVSYSGSGRDSPKNLQVYFNEVSAFEDFDKQNIPARDVPYYAKNDLFNTALESIGGYNYNTKENKIAGKIDIDRDFHLTSNLLLNAKFGGKFSNRYREYDYDSFGGNLIGCGSGGKAQNLILDTYPWMKDIIAEGGTLGRGLPFTLFIDKDYNTGDFLKGKYAPWPGADIGLMYDIVSLFQKKGDWGCAFEKRLDFSSISRDYSGNEYLKAGYGMMELQYGNTFQFITGLRYEEVKRVYTAPQGNSITGGFPEEHYHYIDTTTTVININLLPMVLIKIKPVEWFDIRFAYTNTLSRPSYSTITPQSNITYKSVSMNNYKLKPMLSQNFDLYFSFYGNDLGLFTIGGFTKKIKDMIFSNGGRIILDPAEYGLSNDNKGKVLYTYLNNQYDVKLWGIETSWQTYFRYLPGLLSGFMFDINYTHIFSEAKYPRSTVKTELLNEAPWVKQTIIDTFYTARMVDQPDDIVNISLGYDHKGFSGRISLLYQSNIFRGVDFWEELRNNTDDYWRWDLSLKQELPIDGLQLFVNVRNITGTFDRTILNVSQKYPISEQFYGTGMDLGLRYRL